MDIRSPNAHVIKQAYAQQRMYSMEGTAVDGDTGQIYARTNYGRFVRLDQSSRQLNILSPDRRTFAMADALAPDERIMSGPDVAPMTHDVLLPPLSVWQHIGTWAPWVATMIGSFGLGYAARAAWSSHAHAASLHHHDVDAHAIAQGWQEHPVPAPNDCILDGSDEATLRAMLPGHCQTPSAPRVQFLSGSFDDASNFDTGNDQNMAPAGYDAPITTLDPSDTPTFYVAADGASRSWKDASFEDNALFCLMAAPPTLAAAGVVASGVNALIESICKLAREQNAQLAYAEFQARQRAARAE